MTAVPNSTTVDSGHHKATMKRVTTEGLQKSGKKCEQQVLGTVVGRWRQQHKTQLDGEK